MMGPKASRFSVLLLLQLLLVDRAVAAERLFRFAPRTGVRYVRTLTHHARMEVGGVMRTETTILRAKFVFRSIPSGFELTMTPLSFRYLVNDREEKSPVWELISGHPLRMKFNVVGKLTTIRGYEEIDQQLTQRRREANGPAAAFHLDLYPIGEEEKVAWDTRTMLWIDQPAAPGSSLAFDSTERSFAGQPVKSHTEMKVLRTKPCGVARCVSTVYKMVPDLEELMRHVNEHVNDDFIGASATRTIEQTIEPATMLLHYERVTWSSTLESLTAEGKQARYASMIITSEFAYESSAESPAEH